MADKAWKALTWRLKRAWIESCCRILGHSTNPQSTPPEFTEDDVLWCCSRCGEPLSESEVYRTFKKRAWRKGRYHA